jgi:hypothetical protein
MKKPTLDMIYSQMLHEARKYGRSTATLGGGVRLTLVMERGHMTLAIWRKHKKVGETGVFRRYCGVPDGAERVPAEGQLERREENGVVWHGFAWRWSDKQELCWNTTNAA